MARLIPAVGAPDRPRYAPSSPPPAFMVPHARLSASTVIGSDELDALSLGLAVVDARWGIIRWTHALAQLTGVSTQEAL
ncbi:MAG TPA: hypothetical protein VJ650_17085, partial [Gemmatimonadaceae bacterium]|nr:hypothetical protein [Gemmatimonadaceae bacterium]